MEGSNRDIPARQANTSALKHHAEARAEQWPRLERELAPKDRSGAARSCRAREETLPGATFLPKRRFSVAGKKPVEGWVPFKTGFDIEGRQARGT